VSLPTYHDMSATFPAKLLVSAIPLLLLLLGANMSTGALFHEEMSETTSIGVSGWVISEGVLAQW
jgi:hypothetical protein